MIVRFEKSVNAPIKERFKIAMIAMGKPKDFNWLGWNEWRTKYCYWFITCSCCVKPTWDHGTCSDCENRIHNYY